MRVKSIGCGIYRYHFLTPIISQSRFMLMFPNRRDRIGARLRKHEPAEIAPTMAERSIRRRIRRHGPITFSEYMTRALYAAGGYYTRPDRSPLADYYTSPQVHPAFGALLAVELYHCWNLLDRPAPFVVVEPGAGDGLLAHDILTAATYLPDGFAPAIRYIAVDRQAASGWEAGFANGFRCVGDALRLPMSGAVGCVVSNELLDALPVHRVRMEPDGLRELYVDVTPDVADGYEGVLIERPGEPSTSALAQRLADAGVHLQPGQTTEICLLLDDWAESAAAALTQGFVITIDYGRTAVDLYDPAQRPDGTLVTYRGHVQTDSPLVDAGRQDITAQVDFTSLQRAGERAGLNTVGNVPQGWLLQRLGLQTLRHNGPPSGGLDGGWQSLTVGSDGSLPDELPAELDAAPDQGRAWLTALTHLVRPGGLGDFRVLVRARGVPADTAVRALGWLDDDDTHVVYTPASLAARIPPDALRLGDGRLPLLT